MLRQGIQLLERFVQADDVQICIAPAAETMSYSAPH
jgi:hypothetical protein